jgi:conjugal transfer pilin signal peptidase TrbI
MIKLLNLKAVIRSFGYFIGSICLVFIASQNLRFLISETDSVSQHYFIQVFRLPAKLNNYTVVWSDWYHGLIIKKIIGVAGSKVWFKDGKLFVNNVQVGSYKNIATDGRILHPIAAQLIPHGYVFLAANHPQSFDSRYQELGLVAIDKLQGRVFPLF